MTLVAEMASAAIVAATTWYPAPGWTEHPDPVASQRARRGGVVRFSGGQPPKSYNAYVDNNLYTRMTFDLMYENLLSIDAATLDFEPALARRWAVSDDGHEFTFVLDYRAKWSDGVPVTAADVKWTFDAVVDPTSDTGPWKTTLGVFESPEVVDGRTVRFRKKGDSPKDWRDLASCGLFWILPRHAFAGKAFNTVSLVGMPVSSAYSLHRVDEQISCEFRVSDTWWRREFPSVRGMCNFDRIVLRYYADGENAFEAFKKRMIDVYPVYSARIMNAETKGERFARNWILKRRVRNHDPIGFQGFAMNMRRPPFDKLKVRQAMAKLIDRETMNQTLMNGEYFLLRSYYTDLYDAAHPCANRQWAYDPEGARRLLAEAGLANGFRFSFLSRSAGEDKFLALFSSALARCGVEMDIVRKDFAGWMRDMDSFSFDMTWASWGASVIRTPETTWHSREGRRPGGNNITGLAIPEVDELIEREKTMMSAADREDAYRRIDRLVTDAVPYVLLWHTDEHRLLYWNKFGTPETVLGRLGGEEGVLSYWWHDDDRARELDAAIGQGTCLPDVPLRVDYDAAAR
ncbi:MAG: ABC transporter substrate-binding protein [Kiritimatiellae bacterium]|nr:ABC transporter substrate-binding protein [Kiritimatiellia bacterium]